MAYFRCMVAQGGTTNSYKINVTTSVSPLYGKTATLKKGTTTVATATISNSGTCSFTVTATGTYTVTANDGNQTFTTEVTVTDTVTATLTGFTWQAWLTAADISTAGYSSLDDVLADEVAVRKLMTIHASVDYLVDSLV